MCDRRYINKRRFRPPATSERETRQAHLCVFCQEVLDLDRPHQSSCGDRACYTCLEVLTSYFKERGVMKCPGCQQPLQLSEFFHDRAVARELKSILVICPYGCQWEGLYEEYQNHLQTCPMPTCESELATPDPRSTGSEVLTGSRVLLDLSVFEGEVVPGIERLLPPVVEVDTDECVLSSILRLPQVKVFDDPQRQLCEIDSIDSISLELVAQQLKSVSLNAGRAPSSMPPRPDLGHIETAITHIEERITKQTSDFSNLMADFQRLKMDTQMKYRSTETMQASSYGSVYVWKIPDFTRRRRDAVLGKTISLYSAPFYTSRHGYKLCMRVYLNGDGAGRGSHISLFVCLMKGNFDPLLPWPFRQTITLVLLSQDSHVKDIKQSFKPDGESSSFQRPMTEMNVASGCPQFCHLDLLNDHTYVRDNTMYLKAFVSTRGIEHLT